MFLESGLGGGGGVIIRRINCDRKTNNDNNTNMLSCKGKAESVGRLLKTIKINDIPNVCS